MLPSSDVSSTNRFVVHFCFVLNYRVQNPLCDGAVVQGRTSLDSGRQDFLDSLVDLRLSKSVVDWYTLDVLTTIGESRIIEYDVNESSGKSLLMLNYSAILCDPETLCVRHYPRHLLHCFVEDLRKHPDPSHPGAVFQIELFSVTPKHEQLSWTHCAHNEAEIPSLQSAAGRWMNWLERGHDA